MHHPRIKEIGNIWLKWLGYDRNSLFILKWTQYVSVSSKLKINMFHERLLYPQQLSIWIGNQLPGASLVSSSGKDVMTASYITPV